MTDVAEDVRSAEIAKYRAVYAKHAHYRMHDDRRDPVLRALFGLTGSLLDVSCGRGELLKGAAEMGFAPVAGTEVVPELIAPPVVYGALHNLPFETAAYDVVTCIDVLEHLLPGDVVPALLELQRVTRGALLIAVADYPTWWDGHNLHPSARPYDEWDRLFREHLSGDISRVGSATSSEMWMVTYR